MMTKLNIRSWATSVSVAALTVGLALVAEPAQKASAQLTGSGATSIESLVDIWFTQRGVTYNLTGSGTGRTQFTNGLTDFVSTDFTQTAVEGQVVTNIVNIPVSLVYNVPGFQADLSREQIIGIINGSITNWSTVGGPDLPIRFVYRSDSSGTTTILNNFLGVSIPSNLPPNSVGVIGSSGVTDAVAPIEGQEGNIGYVDTPAALQAGRQIANPNVTIAGPNFIIFRGFYANADTANAARNLCTYLAIDGAAFAASLGYVNAGQSPDVCNAIQGP